MGCVMCGWSVMIEMVGRRKDMVLFVVFRVLVIVVFRLYFIEK